MFSGPIFEIAKDLSEESLQQMMEMDQNPASLVDFAFALTQSQRGGSHGVRQRVTSTGQSSTNRLDSESSTGGTAPPPPPPKKVELDALFSEERLRSFRMEMARKLIEMTNQKTENNQSSNEISVALCQLLIHITHSIDIDDIEEVSLLEFIVDFLVKERVYLFR